MIHLLKTFSILGFSAILISCSGDDKTKSIDSSIVSTEKIYATIQVISDESNAIYVEAQLTKNLSPQEGSGDEFFVKLVGDDELWLSRGTVGFHELSLDDNLFSEAIREANNHVRLRSFNTEQYGFFFLFIFGVFNEIGTWYSATLPSTDAVDNEPTFTVMLSREDGDSLTKSSITLAEPFDLLIAGDDTPFNRSTDSVELIWDAVQSQFRVEISALTTCTDGSFSEYSFSYTNDPGAHIIPAGDLDSPVFSGECSTTVTVNKISTGQLSSKFTGGIINGQQARKSVIRSNP